MTEINDRISMVKHIWAVQSSDTAHRKWITDRKRGWELNTSLIFNWEDVAAKSDEEIAQNIAAYKKEETVSVVRLLYGTNLRDIEAKAPKARYSDHEGELSYDTCLVTIPPGKKHRGKNREALNGVNISGR